MCNKKSKPVSKNDPAATRILIGSDLPFAVYTKRVDTYQVADVTSSIDAVHQAVTTATSINMRSTLDVHSSTVMFKDLPLLAAFEGVYRNRYRFCLKVGNSSAILLNSFFGADTPDAGLVQGMVKFRLEANTKVVPLSTSISIEDSRESYSWSDLPHVSFRVTLPSMTHPTIGQMEGKSFLTLEEAVAYVEGFAVVNNGVKSGVAVEAFNPDGPEEPIVLCVWQKSPQRQRRVTAVGNFVWVLPQDNLLKKVRDLNTQLAFKD